jgi:hypothetical protein
MSKPKYQLGQAVAFSKAYHIKAEGRFPCWWEGKTKEPMPCMESGNGVVAGIRRVIMANYEYQTPNWEGDEGSDWPSKGTRETVLLVSYDLRRKPVYVRLCDVVEQP